MKLFKLDNIYSIQCEYINKTSCFKHKAVLYKHDNDVAKTSVEYYNRTWECFEYETVAKKVIDNYFDENKRVKYKEKLKNNYSLC